MLNQVNLIGRLGRDPEIRYTQNGNAVCNFTIATDESYKDKEGEKQEKTEWHRIVAWGRLAEICAEYLTKGSLIYLAGKIETTDYEDKEGNTRYQTQIIAREMKMLGGKKNDDDEQFEE